MKKNTLKKIVSGTVSAMMIAASLPLSTSAGGFDMGNFDFSQMGGFGGGDGGGMNFGGFGGDNGGGMNFGGFGG
ncbi:hypothetical protein, partial [Ruminococcus flavefaciens]